MRWWAPLGGLIGAYAVVAGLLFVGKVGAGACAGLTITANILMSQVIDQFGLFGMETHALSAGRVAGGDPDGRGHYLDFVFLNEGVIEPLESVTLTTVPWVGPPGRYRFSIRKLLFLKEYPTRHAYEAQTANRGKLLKTQAVSGKFFAGFRFVPAARFILSGAVCP